MRMQRASRLGIVLVTLVALVLATVTRQWAAGQRGERNLAAATPLSRMNSYALALLLGGLRGPLVMFLWPSSEGQKSEKNLEDFDTKVEWIRLLQAEFDTVHIFQIWNKAYNISVLMANVANKYATILDALEYARNVDKERPGNINILQAIAGLFGEKLGNANPEKHYYKKRVREETMAREPLVRVTFGADRKQAFVDAVLGAGGSARRLDLVENRDEKTVSVTVRKSLADAIRPRFEGEGIAWVERQRQRINPDAPGFRRTELDPMLDREGNILAEYLAPRGGAAASPGYNDGSELQYLKPYQPFPYGISAHALGYNYYKRAQGLLRGANQHHANLSDLVVDSRPALGLRNWSEDEWELGRLAELEALGLAVPPEARDDRKLLEAPAREVKLDAAVRNAALLREAIFNYDRAAAVAEASNEEYLLHLGKFRTNFLTYRAHMDDLTARVALLRGDRDYLKLLSGAVADRAALIRSAIEHYRDSAQRFRLVLLVYYVEPEHVRLHFPPGTTPQNVDRLPADQVEKLVERLLPDAAVDGAAHYDDWTEYMSYVRRAQFRLKNLTEQPTVAGGAN